MVQWVKCLLGKHRLKFRFPVLKKKLEQCPISETLAPREGREWRQESEGSLTSQSS